METYKKQLNGMLSPITIPQKKQIISSSVMHVAFKRQSILMVAPQ